MTSMKKKILSDTEIDGTLTTTDKITGENNLEIDGTSQFNDDVSIGTEQTNADTTIHGDLTIPHLTSEKEESGQTVKTGVLLVTDDTGKVIADPIVDLDELHKLNDITDNIQDQIDDLDAAAVHKAGEETITGAKTFTSVMTGTNGIDITNGQNRLVVDDVHGTVITGPATVNGAFATPNISDNGDTTNAGHVIVDANLSVSGNINQTTANTTANLQATTVNSLAVTNAAVVEGTLNVVNNITGNGQLRIDGISQFNDNLTVATGHKITTPEADIGTVNGTNSNKLSVTTPIEVTGSVSATTDISAAQDISAGRDLSVARNATVTGTLGVTGATTLSSVSASSNIVQTGGTATLKGTTVDTLSSVGDAAFGGNITQSAAQQGETRTAVLQDTTLKSLVVNGPIQQTGGAATLKDTTVDTLTINNLDQNMVLVSNTNGQVVVSSAIDVQELNTLENIHTNTTIQDQLDGKAPVNHASEGTTYGVGTPSHYGHVMFDGRVTPNRVSNSNKIAISEEGIIDFVNQSVNNIAAYYITYHIEDPDTHEVLYDGPFPNHATLLSATASELYSGGHQRTPTRNDYTIVSSDESHEQYTQYDGYVNFDTTMDYIGHYIEDVNSQTGYKLIDNTNYNTSGIVVNDPDLPNTPAYERIVPSTRYIYNSDSSTYSSSNWNFQYTFNQQYTQAQMAALNSGITAAKVDLLDTVERGAEVNVQADWDQNTITSDDYIKNKPLVVNAWPQDPNDLSDKNYPSEKLTKMSLDGKLDDAQLITSWSTGDASATDSNIPSAKLTKDTLDTKQNIMASGTGITIANDGITINHTNSVTANTAGIGSATAIPILKYDAQGHITEVTTATIYPPTTAGTAGHVWKSDGTEAGQWSEVVGTAPITVTNTSDTTTTITHNDSGVTAGTYKSVTVDAKGHITDGDNPTTLNGYGITDEDTSINLETGAITIKGRSITPLSAEVLRPYVTNREGSASVPANVPMFSDTSGKDIVDSGYSIASSVPSGAIFTDYNVAQQGSDVDAEYPILLKNTTTVTDETSPVNYVSSGNVSVNPSTGAVSANALYDNSIRAVTGVSIGNQPFSRSGANASITAEQGFNAIGFTSTTISLRER